MNRKRSLWLLALVPIAALIWAMKSAASWRPQLLGVQPGAQQCLLSPNGKLLLVHDGSGVGQMWDAAQWRPLWKNRGGSPVFSADSRWIAIREGLPVARNQKRQRSIPFILREAHNGRLVHFFSDEHLDSNEDFLDASFSPDSRHFTMATSRKLRHWDVATGRLIDVRPWTRGKGQIVFDIAAITPDGEVFAPFTEKDTTSVAIYDARTGQKLRAINADVDADNYRPFVFAPDGYSVQVLGLKTINFYRRKDGKSLFRFPLSQLSVFSNDGALIYRPLPTGLDVYDAHTGRKLKTLPGPTAQGFVVSTDGNWLYSAQGGKIYRWRAR